MGEIDLIPTIAKVLATFGLLFVTLKVVARFYGPGAGANPRRTGGVARPQIQVLARQSMGRNVSVVVARIAGRHVALGVGPNGVTMLCDIDPSDDDTIDDLSISDIDLQNLTSPSPAPTGSLFEGPAGTPGPHTRPTWKGLVESLRERTVRH